MTSSPTAGIWVNRPSPKATETAYESPPKPDVPALRGLALYYAAKLYVSYHLVSFLFHHRTPVLMVAVGS